MCVSPASSMADDSEPSHELAGQSFTIRDVIENKVPVARPMKPATTRASSVSSTLPSARGDAAAAAAAAVSRAPQAPAPGPAHKLQLGVDGRAVYTDDGSRKQEIVRQSHRTDEFKVGGEVVGGPVMLG